MSAQFRCFICVAIAACLLPGCGTNPEPERIRGVITVVADAAQEEEMFQSIFVSGSAPADREAYATSSYSPVEPVTNQGSSATVSVTVTPARMGGAAGDNAAQTEPEGSPKTVQWTLEKVGENWKIKSAPLQ